MQSNINEEAMEAAMTGSEAYAAYKSDSVVSAEINGERVDCEIVEIRLGGLHRDHVKVRRLGGGAEVSRYVEDIE